MKTKIASLTAVACLAITPFASHAAPAPTTAFNACVKAFVNSYLPDRTVRATKTTNSPGLTALTLTQRKYTIALSARGANSGELLANARCVADGKGIVLVLDTPPTLDYVAQADFRADVR